MFPHSKSPQMYKEKKGKLKLNKCQKCVLKVKPIQIYIFDNKMKIGSWLRSPLPGNRDLQLHNSMLLPHRED